VLNLKCDKLISRFAFNFNVRRYSMGFRRNLSAAEIVNQAGAHTRPPFGST